MYQQIQPKPQTMKNVYFYLDIFRFSFLLLPEYLCPHWNHLGIIIHKSLSECLLCGTVVNYVLCAVKL